MTDLVVFGQENKSLEHLYYTLKTVVEKDKEPGWMTHHKNLLKLLANVRPLKKVVFGKKDLRNFYLNEELKVAIDKSKKGPVHDAIRKGRRWSERILGFWSEEKNPQPKPPPSFEGAMAYEAELVEKLELLNLLASLQQFNDKFLADCCFKTCECDLDKWEELAAGRPIYWDLEVGDFCGCSPNRLTGASNGSMELTLKSRVDGISYTWPQGYVTYIRDHWIKVDPDFKAFVMACPLDQLLRQDFEIYDEEENHHLSVEWPINEALRWFTKDEPRDPRLSGFGYGNQTEILMYAGSITVGPKRIKVHYGKIVQEMMVKSRLSNLRFSL